MIGRLLSWIATGVFHKALNCYNQHQYKRSLRWFGLASKFYPPICHDPCFATYLGFAYFKTSQLEPATKQMEMALFLLRSLNDRTLAEALTREVMWKLTKIKRQDYQDILQDQETDLKFTLK